MRHTDVAEMILEESGYTEMWQLDRSAEAPGRLENLKELVNNMGEYESLRAFLEHVALVMDTAAGESGEAVSIMTLHSAKGLEFDTVYLPGWEEGLFPSQRTIDENGKAGLEEERRLAYVGLTRARKNAKIWFVSNRRVHGMWQSTVPSRFLDDLPEAHVDVSEPASYGGLRAAAGSGGGYGMSRFDTMEPFNSAYRTPGWQRRRPTATAPTRASAPSASRHHRGRADRQERHRRRRPFSRGRPRLPPESSGRAPCPSWTATS
jgi:DNA helicase-2/ATP-dependent DNA helicase PcrA